MYWYGVIYKRYEVGKKGGDEAEKEEERGKRRRLLNIAH